ncbi:MAG: hypothetical protein WKF71_16870 [Pyrinomonadaceae bacterium]
MAVDAPSTSAHPRPQTPQQQQTPSPQQMRTFMQRFVTGLKAAKFLLRRRRGGHR